MGYIPGEPDEGFLNGAIPTTHATNSFVVGSSNADPVADQVEADDEFVPVPEPVEVEPAAEEPAEAPKRSRRR